MPARGPVLAETREAIVQPDDPAAEPIPEPGVRPKEQDECVAAAEPL